MNELCYAMIAILGIPTGAFGQMDFTAEPTRLLLLAMKEYASFTCT